MVRELTEEELCEIAEMKNRLAHLLVEAKDEQVSEKDLLYMILLELEGLKEGMTYLLFDINDEDDEEETGEVLHTDIKEEETE